MTLVAYGLITLGKLECARMVQRHTKSCETGQMFKNEMRGSRTGRAHTQRAGLLFFLLLREGKAENWDRGCDDALAVLLEFRGQECAVVRTAEGEQYRDCRLSSRNVAVKRYGHDVFRLASLVTEHRHKIFEVWKKQN